MLSILIPTYNYLIVELVNRVHKQAITATIPFEIIIIDDCSTNKDIINANKIINGLEFCTYIQNDNNLGRTASRNILAIKAKYNLLLFLDADEYLTEQFSYHQVLNRLASYDHRVTFYLAALN